MHHLMHVLMVLRCHYCLICHVSYFIQSCLICLDPFSAVDMTVGKHMMQHGVQEMLKGKTRLVVLNSHLHFLAEFDKVSG